MSDQQLHNLIKMLEQIIANNLHHGSDQQVAAVATDHVHKFWARSMKQIIIAYAEENPAELSNVAQLAITQLEAQMDKSTTN